MPYRTKSGSHYHETYGCHGATIPCDTKGLTPCTTCCGGGGKGTNATPAAGGTPVGASAGQSSGMFDSDGGFSETGTASIDISPATDIARIMSVAQLSETDHAKAPDVTVTPDTLARSIGATSPDKGESDFSRLPKLGSVAELRMRGRVEGMRGDQYVVHVKDYEGSNRTNYKFSLSKPTALHRRQGQFVRIDWEDDYWDKSGYGFIRVDGEGGDDGLGGIDDTFSFSDYDSKRFANVLRGAGMSDADFRQMVGDALDGFGVRRQPTGRQQTRAKASSKSPKANPSRRPRRKSDVREFADAVNAGDGFLVRLHASGADVEDDDALAKAFDDAVRNGELDVPEHLRGATWASVLDARERELGWD